MIRHLSRGIVLFTLLLASCNTQPDYPIARLCFDPDLLGTWISKEKPDEKPNNLTMYLTQLDVPSDDERVNPRTPLGTPRPEGTTPCYHIYLECSDPEMHLELFGYLLTIQGKTMMGVQVSSDHLFNSGIGGWVLPLHHLFPFEHRENELHIFEPAALAWVPNARWIDEPAAPTSEPGAILNEKSEGTVILTNSIDRLLAEYDAARNPAAPDPNDILVFQRK